MLKLFIVSGVCTARVHLIQENYFLDRQGQVNRVSIDEEVIHKKKKV